MTTNTDLEPTPRRSRKWLIAVLIALPLVLAATVVALSRSAGTLAPYRFLAGAEGVYSERFKESTSALTVRVYNIHRPFAEVRAAVDKELSAQGWKCSGPGTDPSETWWPSTVSKGGPTFDKYISLVGGRARRAPFKGVDSVIAKNEVAEGWSALAIIEPYKPSWFDRLLDRFRGPPTRKMQEIDLQLVPSQAYRKFAGMDSVKRKP